MLKKLYKIYLLIIINFFTFIGYAKAQLLDPAMRDEIGILGEKAGGDAGFDKSAEIGATAEIIIEAFLSVLGIIFIILMIIAGYNWMSAAGDEQKVTKAQDTIRRAIIGLIILASAYAITAFVFKNLPGGATGVSSPL